MKKLVTLSIVLALLLGTARLALAEGPTPNGHNCAGVVVKSNNLDWPGPMGPLVAEYAHLQLIDNLGLANCGNANGQNP
ncbi:MAG: hypothetical protein IT317_12630 [Anaerolineales bacterium]|nr:hypothetical protein [Anaerolineales bacterium]